MGGKQGQNCCEPQAAILAEQMDQALKSVKENHLMPLFSKACRCCDSLGQSFELAQLGGCKLVYFILDSHMRQRKSLSTSIFHSS